MQNINKMKIKIFADGANPEMIMKYNNEAYISGFTTNPTLMKASGIQNYESFAKQILEKVTKPISFEVFSDELSEMKRQAFKIATWGPNVYVKIPVTNSKSESTVPVIQALAAEGVKMNITALFTLDQLKQVHQACKPNVPSVLSVFAGRIADTGRDPMTIMAECRKYLGENTSAELLWASPRELYNLIQAEECGCDIITMSPDLLKKIPMLGKNLVELSLDTVKMFKNDAEAAGYQL
jgi:transaldolase